MRILPTRRLAVLAALVTAVVPVTAAAVPSAASAVESRQQQTGPQRYVLRLDSTRPGDVAALRSAVETAGGRVIAVQGTVGTAVVEAPDGERLRALPGVRDVVADGELRATSLGFSASSQAGAMTNVTRLTGATTLWKAGVTGKGVDVALVDSGVAPVPALKDAAKVVVGPDLSFESQDVDLRFLDTYGHGTHMAGIIAGRETAAASGSTYAADTTNFYGMAPDARIVSLKLADRNGIVDVSQVIAAIDWVVAHRASDGLNIRVLNLSYGTVSDQAWDYDPLAWAAEVAWHRGVVVVASAGNDGTQQTTLASPAYDPWLLAVGAADTKGTDSRADDSVPSFSARPTYGWVRSVDVVAPGVGIVSAAVPGSYLAATYPAAQVGNGFLRGSGTSQAAAVVSGAVALLLQQRPSLTPDQVRDLLRRSAVPLAGETENSQGAGEIDVLAASKAAPSATPPTPAAWGHGGGSIETTRNGRDLVMDGQALYGEVDLFNQYFDGSATAQAELDGSAWNGGTWNGSDWVGGAFTGDTVTWAGKTWTGKTWTGKTWTGKTWTGKTWTSVTLSSATWNGSGWSSASWSSTTAIPTWASAIWSSSSWK